MVRPGTSSALHTLAHGFNFHVLKSFLVPRRTGFHIGAHDVNRPVKNGSQAGFSFIETLAVLGILGSLLTFALPFGRSVAQILSVSGDARNIGAGLNLARMQAASQNTHGRLYVDLSANTFHVEFWNKTGNCWQIDNVTAAATCDNTAGSVTKLAPGVTFGFGSLTQGPTAATSTIAQAPVCYSGVAGTNSGTAIDNTACIEFSSRGFALDHTGAVVASEAVYIQSEPDTRIFGIVVGLPSQPQIYGYSGSGSVWNSY